MFELSWAELLLVAVLALLIIGPKDLPVVFKNLGKLVAQGQRLWRRLQLSMHQLEREVSQTSTPDQPTDWQQWLPEELRHLPADYLPGSMTAEQHAARHAEQQRLLAQRANHVSSDHAQPTQPHVVLSSSSDSMTTTSPLKPQPAPANTTSTSTT